VYGCQAEDSLFYKLMKLFFSPGVFSVIISYNMNLMKLFKSFTGMRIWFYLILSVAAFNYAGVYANSILDFAPPPDEYSLRLIPDSLILTSSAGLFLTGKIVQNNKPSVTLEEIGSLNSDSVFILDRVFMRDFSEGFNLASGITEYSSLAMPLIPLAGTAFNSNYKQSVSIIVEYSEALMYSLGTKNLLKGLVKRFRPYAYYSETEGYFSPSYLVTENPETAMSFPSGHTTAAFTGAVFAGMMFNRYYPDSPLKIPLWITVLAAASATGVLRVMSGNHYVTDVVSGAVIGSFFGFIVPFMHDIKYE